MSKVIKDKDVDTKNLDLPEDMTGKDILYFKIAPLTSAV